MSQQACSCACVTPPARNSVTNAANTATVQQFDRRVPSDLVLFMANSLSLWLSQVICEPRSPNLHPFPRVDRTISLFPRTNFLVYFPISEAELRPPGSNFCVERLAFYGRKAFEELILNDFPYRFYPSHINFDALSLALRP
jgi:hypothetical protein